MAADPPRPDPPQAAGTGATGDTAVVIPAKNEADRIADTVTAARGLPGVDLVVVVDDGSTDATTAMAARAGARVIRHDRNRGKATAMESGAQFVGRVEAEQGRSAPRHLLFLDADLGATAKEAAPLIEPVRSGAADMSIARFPAGRAKGGGHGFVVRLARAGIAATTGWVPDQPLNGQRCVSRRAFEAARPLASGFGVETALTIDLITHGFRVTEVEVPLDHRTTGTDWRAQVHRGRQFADVARALAARQLRPAAVRTVRRWRRRVSGSAGRAARP